MMISFYEILLHAFRRSEMAHLLPDKMFVALQYRAMTRKKLRLNPPIDFNEKLQWLKLYYRNPLMVTCADKWAVREFVTERICEK